MRYWEKYRFCFDTDKNGAAIHLSLNIYFLLFECSGLTGMFEQFSVVTAKCTSSSTCYSIITLYPWTDKAPSPPEEAGPVKSN